MVYLSSDGLTDQNNVRRKKLGSKSLEDCIEKNIKLPLKEQKQAIITLLENHSQETEQRDDILCLGIKINNTYY